MGQKVNPIGYRIGVNKDWDSRWYAEKDYSTKLINDIKIREYIEKNMGYGASCFTLPGPMGGSIPCYKEEL